jgi:hypothetical protein
LTVEEAARVLRIAPVSVYRKIAAGSLPAFRLGAPAASASTRTSSTDGSK